MKTRKSRRNTARRKAQHKKKISKALKRVGSLLKKKRNGRLTSA
jgi:hypothetical protein